MDNGHDLFGLRALVASEAFEIGASIDIARAVSHKTFWGRLIIYPATACFRKLEIACCSFLVCQMCDCIGSPKVRSMVSAISKNINDFLTRGTSIFGKQRNLEQNLRR